MALYCSEWHAFLGPLELKQAFNNSLEFLAVKAKQGSWLLQLLDHLPNIYNEAGVARDNLLKLNTYPGLAFARALILFDREDAKSGAVEHHKDSSAALTDAILTFPFVIPILFDKLGLNIPSAYLTHPRAGLRTSFDSSRPDSFLHLLGQLYVFRNESLFKPPEILEWLQSIVKQSESRLDDSSNESVRRGQSFADGSGLYGKDVVPSGILRHLVAADITQLRPHFPSGLLASITNTFDPLPPEGGSTYDDEYFRGVITSSATRGAPPATRDQLRAALERLLPQMDDEEDADPELQAAIQAQLDAMAHGQHGLPGGIPDVEDDEVVHQETEADATDTPDAQQQQGGWTAWAQSWLRLGGGNTRNPDPNHRADHEAE